MKPNEFPKSARDAFDLYPQIEASPAFNRVVLQQLKLENARRQTTFVGRLEAWLGLSVWRFAASGMLGAFVPGVLLAGVMWSNRGATPTQNRPVPTPLKVRALGPFYAREWESGWKRAPQSRSLQPRSDGSDVPRTETSKGDLCVDSPFRWA